MVIDTSAVLAVLMDEAESEAIRVAIEGDPVRLMSTASFVEASIVVETRYGEAGARELDLLLHTAQVELVPVDREQAEVARDAFRAWGKGRHRAGLNFGDCFAYALARVSGERLFFKGDDFGSTDVPSALG
ncbi:MAG: type II toxin-antitoxin system VapC family toxin [Thermoanaerobaculales bacterium]|jgi:ribonuclease VapC|nr:type II toxin-antitoxin system VapC family toxin [Thermoanaerobaculales bacterium]